MVQFLRQVPFFRSPRLELTLAIFKPDLLGNPYSVNAIKQSILDSGFYFVKSRIIRLDRYRAEKFYQEHQGKFFYERLVSFMCSGPISVHILARQDAIRQWRSLMGPTKVYRAQYDDPTSLRGLYGLTDTRNATHGSDSVQSARAEMKFFFNNFNENLWFEEQEKKFRNGQGVRFFVNECEHRINHAQENKQWFF